MTNTTQTFTVALEVEITNDGEPIDPYIDADIVRGIKDPLAAFKRRRPSEQFEQYVKRVVNDEDVLVTDIIDVSGYSIRAKGEP